MGSFLGSPISYQCVKTLILQKHPEAHTKSEANVQVCKPVVASCMDIVIKKAHLELYIQCCTKNLAHMYSAYASFGVLKPSLGTCVCILLIAYSVDR